MVGGYTGKILNIDLKAQDKKISNLDFNDTKKFIGAKGLGAKLLFDLLPKQTNPLSEDNILMFTTGPLTGTSVQTSGRGTVITKSPQTGLFLDSHFGGFFAAEIKKAGFDILILKGSSEKPIYLKIDNDNVDFLDASEIWGKECSFVHNWILEKHRKYRTAVIGPSGENLVKYSAITIDEHRHAGRGGSGAVMGSKKVKAIAIKGDNKLIIHDKENFNRKAKEVLQKIKENDFVPIRRKYGTPYWVKPVNDEGFLPTRNFSEGIFEKGNEINAETMQKNIVDKSGACYNCIIACWNKSSIKKDKYKGISLVGPEYETIALMGSNLGVYPIEEIAYLNKRCNELGMDSISLGGVLGFAIEAFNNKLLSKEDLGGYDIGWGKTDQLARLIQDIATLKTKAGKILAEGVKKASEKLGEKSKKFALHEKGLEIPGYDPRGTFGMALAYATSDRGACHQRAWTAKAELYDPELNRFSFDKKAKIVKNIQDERSSFFSLVLCDFAPISEEDCVDLLNYSTGSNHNVDSYLLAGERIWNLIRLFNLRETSNTISDSLPDRFFNDKFSRGPAKNIKIKKNDFIKCLNDYYKFRKWDKKGIPTKQIVTELDLLKYYKTINLN
jgi:aldehyde:ferredoxin oxidoreductase